MRSYFPFSSAEKNMDLPPLVLILLGAAACTYADEPQRVVGGKDAALGEFPYQAALWQNDRFSCGGSIISRNHILTAAHCIDPNSAPPYDDLLIYTGSILPDGGQSYRIKDIYSHPNFSSHSEDSYRHDIAVIQLLDRIIANEFQMPIDIATLDPPDHAIVQLSGYGRLGTNLPYPEVLQKEDMTVITNEMCELSAKQTIYDTQLCTLNAENYGACSGDSGGPLAYNGKLVGIVSWSYPCARGMPDVYTRVSKYRDFIFNAVSRMSD